MREDEHEKEIWGSLCAKSFLIRFLGTSQTIRNENDDTNERMKKFIEQVHKRKFLLLVLVFLVLTTNYCHSSKSEAIFDRKISFCSRITFAFLP